MFDLDNMVELFIDNLKKLFFPEEWVKLDQKFSKFEIFTMLYLDKRKEVTMTELVEHINSPMSTATGIVDRLVKNGYVMRERSESDRRIVLLKLTEAGAEFVRNLKDMIAGYLQLVLEDLTEDEKQYLTRIALKILGSLQNKLSSATGSAQELKEIKSINIE